MHRKREWHLLGVASAVCMAVHRVQKVQCMLPVTGLLPTLLTCRLRLQAHWSSPPSWWLCKPTQQLEVTKELEGLIRQYFKVVRSTLVETKQGLCSAAAGNCLPSQASLR